MKLVPLGDRVVLKQVEAEEKTKSGIILTSQAQEKPQEATVIAVGPGKDDVKMEVKVDDKVIYSKYAGTEVKERLRRLSAPQKTSETVRRASSPSGFHQFSGGAEKLQIINHKINQEDKQLWQRKLNTERKQEQPCRLV